MRTGRLRIPVIAVAVCLALTVTAGPASAQGSDSQPPRSIAVVGTAAAVAANDAARFSFGVEARRRTAAAALRASSVRMRRVIARLREAGVRAADIQTRRVEVDRASRRTRGGRRPAGYRALNSIAATVRDLALAGRLVDIAVSAGATHAGGPDFFRSDAVELYRGALVAAFDQARAKAQSLAARAGVALGAPLTIRESGAEPEDEELEHTSDAITAPGRAEAVPIRPGRTRIEAKVFVVFAIS